MPSTVAFLRNIALTPAHTGGRTSTVGEPSVATNGPNVFFTGNWYASRTSDDGASWQQVDPFTTLPPAEGGFCCDQTTLFVPGHDVTVWLLQYIQEANTNTLRIAVNADPALEPMGWSFWDLRPVDVNPDWAGEWFDYNHAVISEAFLYVGTNVFTVAGDRWTRSVVFRIALDTLTAAGALTYDYFESTENFSLRCAQGTTGTMYIASHNTRAQLRVFAWPEGGTTVTATDVDVTPWQAGAYSAPGPDGRNWMSRCDPRITGAWAANGQLGIMWSANRDVPRRPLPHVRVVVLDEASLTVAHEPDIWHPEHAYAYPEAAPNRAGDVGVTMFRGGGPVFPGHVVGFLDQAPAWQLRVARSGTDGPADGKWGDYLSCRRHAPDGHSWTAAGYTLRGGGDRTNVEPRYVQFARRGHGS